MGLQERVFGRWQDQSVAKVVDFKVPGLYFLNARTYGFKGWVGGSHSWLVHVDQDYKQTVLEVTSYETLRVQGASDITGFKEYTDEVEQQVLVSNREGGQMWFGHRPRVVVYLGPLVADTVLDWTKNYPLLRGSFSILQANCNTFTSWIMSLLGVELWTGIGAKSPAKWQKNGKSVK